MKYNRLFAAIMLAGCIFGASRLDCMAVQLNYKPLKELPPGAVKLDYIELGVESGRYEVKPGDTLWGISRKFFGTGARYEEIVRENGDIVSDPQLLMPGDMLVVSEQLYIPRDRYDGGGLVSEGAFHIAQPGMVDHDFFLTTDITVSDACSSDISVFSLPVKNRMGENALTASAEDWDAFVAEVLRCSETCGGRVSNLQFEKYTVEDGCDMCGYSFDFATGDKIEEYVVFYRLGERNMAEVIGRRARGQEEEADSALIDVTRYIAASFEDFGGRIGMGYTKVTDNVGAYDWNYPELHNLFTSAMQSYVVYAERPDENYPGDYEIIWKEPVLEQAVRNALTELWQLDEKEKEEFLKRPLMASDMAVITDIECALYKWWNKGDKQGGGPVLYLDFNGYVEEIYPEEGELFSYEDFGNFTGAETFTIHGCALTDYSFISNMIHLKKLCIVEEETVENIEFLSSLKELRTLQLSGAYSYKEGEPAGFLEITDLSVLKNCKQLRYLYLQTPRVTDFSFLQECPEICTMDLSGEWKGEEAAIPDMELLPNARFLDFYGENYRFEP